MHYRHIIADVDKTAGTESRMQGKGWAGGKTRGAVITRRLYLKPEKCLPNDWRLSGKSFHWKGNLSAKKLEHLKKLGNVSSPDRKNAQNITQLGPDLRIELHRGMAIDWVLHPQFLGWHRIPRGDGIRMWAFEGGVRISALIKKAPQVPLPFCHVRSRQKGTSCEPGAGLWVCVCTAP